jgi:ferrous iron transport protein B
MLNLPWGVEHRKDSYLGRAGQVVAPALAPLGFGTWEAASALITGVIAKEIVVGTMAEIYAPGSGEGEAEAPPPTPGEDLREIATGLGAAVSGAATNVASTFGVASMGIEEEEATPLQEALRGTFTPLSAIAFMVFVLLYMPCVVVAIAMRQELGGWRWFGLAFAWQTAVAWGAALAVFQGGSLLGLGGGP